MRSSVAIAFVLLIMPGAASVPAQADPYRWCGVYGGQGGAITNCYFVTIDQCRDAVSGNGGYCLPNNFYDGRPVVTPEEQIAPARRRR
jgi:uncharacterized protein DUF3551